MRPSTGWEPVSVIVGEPLGVALAEKTTSAAVGTRWGDQLAVDVHCPLPAPPVQEMLQPVACRSGDRTALTAAKASSTTTPLAGRRPPRLIGRCLAVSRRSVSRTRGRSGAVLTRRYPIGLGAG